MVFIPAPGPPPEDANEAMEMLTGLSMEHPERFLVGTYKADRRVTFLQEVTMSKDTRLGTMSATVFLNGSLWRLTMEKA